MDQSIQIMFYLILKTALVTGVDRRGHFQSIGETTTTALQPQHHQRQMKPRAEAATTALGESVENADNSESYEIEIDAASPTYAESSTRPAPVAEGQGKSATFALPRRAGSPPRALKHKNLVRGCK